MGGVVLFEDLPLGSYTITETAAPYGYLISSQVITATVSYNADRTARPSPCPPTGSRTSSPWAMFPSIR